MPKCPLHGDECPGDDGGFFIDGNHPDDMFAVHEMEEAMPREKLTPEEIIQRNKDICASYAAGWRVSQVARQFKLDRQRVRQILQEAGVWRPYQKTERVHHLGVMVTADTREALKEKAEAEGMSVSQLASTALEKLVEVHED